MKYNIGLLTQNNDLLSSAKENILTGEVHKFRNFDSIKTDEIDIVFIDIDIFDEGESVQFYLSKIRKKILSIPVLLILRTNQEDLLDFEWFFDDFILFPFRKGEVDLRIKKHLINKEDNEDSSILKLGHLTINFKEYSISRDGEKLDFTYKEFELLRFLLENRGQTFSRKELLNRIWGVEYIGGTRTVDVHIRRLRSKLGEDFNSLIETVRNVGYRCVEKI